jgi:hypothetical protein
MRQEKLVYTEPASTEAVSTIPRASTLRTKVGRRSRRLTEIEVAVVETLEQQRPPPPQQEPSIIIRHDGGMLLSVLFCIIVIIQAATLFYVLDSEFPD